jgi:hypothetical protein
MSTEREPDHTDAAQGRDVGAGYPEEQPGGANPGPAKTGSGKDDDTPDTKGNQDSPPSAATGNPGAAGG